MVVKVKEKIFIEHLKLFEWKKQAVTKYVNQYLNKFNNEIIAMEVVLGNGKFNRYIKN